jgi:hypothetical protein
VVMHIGNKNSRMLAWSFEDQNRTEV